MHERIKKLRRYFNLTQQEFADKLHIKRGSVATFERGNSDPSDAAIALICKTFNVNETWLRTGEGGMFDPDANDTLGAFIRERNLTTTDRILIEKFVSLSIKSRWEVVKFVLGIADALWEECRASVQQRTELDASKQLTNTESAYTDDDIERKTKDYRQRLILEKNQEDTSSPSSEGGTESA